MQIQNLTRYQGWVDKFGQAEVEWLAGEIQAWKEREDPDDRKYDYADNFRVSLVLEFGIPIVDNHGKMIGVDEEYADSRDNGCCGFEDVQFGPSPDGHMYVYGFNYGH